MSAKSHSIGIVLHLDWACRLGVGLSGLRAVGRIFLYGILFNLVFVGVPFCLDALKGDTSAGILTRQVDRDMQVMFAKNPAEVNPTDPIAIYAMLLGWIVLCGMFIQEAREIG